MADRVAPARITQNVMALPSKGGISDFRMTREEWEELYGNRKDGA